MIERRDFNVGQGSEKSADIVTPYVDEISAPFQFKRRVKMVADGGNDPHYILSYTPPTGPTGSNAIVTLNHSAWLANDASSKWISVTNPGTRTNNEGATVALPLSATDSDSDALTYSASGFWTMARYKTPILTIVSNNETYQIVRHNWANQMPDSKMVRDGKYPGLFLGDPATDYVGLAQSQGVEGEAVTTVKDLEPALRRGLERVTKHRRPYLLDVTVAREGIGADATWYDDWEM